jgi:predicted CXXCH cytochrome family protein
LLTRRPRGGVSLKPTQVTADVLRFGRAANCDVLLADIRVGLAEATLQFRDTDGALFLNQAGTNPLRVNGASVGAAAVKPGDEILIGPYKITIVEPEGDVEVALTVELVSPLGDDFARLQTQSVIGLGGTHLSKRRTAWALCLAILVLFLVMPVLGHFFNGQPDPRNPKAQARIIPRAFDETWNVGEISNPHKNFWRECRACHESAFSAVRDEACLTCHTKVPHHVDVKRFPDLVINRTPCGGCHQEHRGAHGVIIQAQELCVDCHGDLKRTAANAELRDVTDFGNKHPEFKVTVVTDAASKTFARIDLGGSAKPTDLPNLKFTHKGHVDPVAWPREMRKLECANCHVPQPGGGLMVPISFPKHCAECHDATLKFDPSALDRAVPHGDAVLAQRSIKDFYARVALEGGVQDLSAPEIVRRRPGTPLSEPERLEALAWATQRALAARDFVFDDFRGCGTCHEVDRAAGEFKVKPVLIQTAYLPKARFNHAKHTTVGCESCHDARQSISSSEVLIPGIDNCRTCHGGESAWAKVRSTCISCHDFHQPGIGLMKASGKSGKTATSAN